MVGRWPAKRKVTGPIPIRAHANIAGLVGAHWRATDRCFSLPSMLLPLSPSLPLSLKRNQQNKVKGKYWIGQKVHLVFSIKGTFFIFTNNVIDLDFLVCRLRHTGQGGCYTSPMHKTAHSRELFGQNVNSDKKLCKPLLTCSISLHTLHKSFIVFQLHFYFS